MIFFIVLYTIKKNGIIHIRPQEHAMYNIPLLHPPLSLCMNSIICFSLPNPQPNIGFSINIDNIARFSINLLCLELLSRPCSFVNNFSWTTLEWKMHIIIRIPQEKIKSLINFLYFPFSFILLTTIYTSIISAKYPPVENVHNRPIVIMMIFFSCPFSHFQFINSSKWSHNITFMNIWQAPGSCQIPANRWNILGHPIEYIRNIW